MNPQNGEAQKSVLTTKEIVCDTQKIVLSSEHTVYKTEGFIALTRRTQAIDAFLSRVAEGMQRAALPPSEGCFSVQTPDGQYTLFVCRRAAKQGETDWIFYKFLCARPDEGGIDRRLSDLMQAAGTLTLPVRATGDTPDPSDFQRLYLVSAADGALNFPHLNETQRKIVETEDANMLVQGVAGSGKTNVCVEKIVYCACRNYRGRVLYTTFSRGLLMETSERVRLFVKNIEALLAAYDGGNLLFLDPDHKKAVENKLGIPFSVDEDGQLIATLRRIRTFLLENVDYLLIEDLYARAFPPLPVAGESVFLNDYLGDSRACRLSGAVEKIKHIAPEILYKEIYGMIFGKYDPDRMQERMEREEYIRERSVSFTRRECEILYALALDYDEFMKRQGYTDNNAMSRRLLAATDAPLYSVGVIDEVQDFTQVNLCLIKKLCRKMFCVGDALQMINPSYFHFGYLKRLMYGDVTGVSELKHNYRSTQKIETIAEALGEMNVQRFGTHSFVLKGESVPSALQSEAVFVKDKQFLSHLGDKRFENLSVLVASQKKKDAVKQMLGNVEVLTVAEAKGLERNTVLLTDVLSDNAEKWRYLQEMTLNRKTADENSVFRYYFNLFYVGVSRARQHLFVIESDPPKFFDRLFDACFQRRNRDHALAMLKEIAGKLHVDDDELIERIDKFCALEQYENARSTADRLSSDRLRETQLVRIDVHRSFLRFGKFREAGVAYWRQGMDAEARAMFTRSGDEKLFPLMDACREGGSAALDIDVVRFFPLVQDNDLARSIILETLDNDQKALSAALKAAHATMRRKP